MCLRVSLVFLSTWVSLTRLRTYLCVRTCVHLWLVATPLQTLVGRSVSVGDMTKYYQGHEGEGEGREYGRWDRVETGPVWTLTGTPVLRKVQEVVRGNSGEPNIMWSSVCPVKDRRTDVYRGFTGEVPPLLWDPASSETGV